MARWARDSRGDEASGQELTHGGLSKSLPRPSISVPIRYHRPTAMIVTPDAIQPATALFRSLADPTRLAIVRRLARGEARVVDLTAELEMPQSTVSTHLACLRDCRLVSGRSVGRQVFYSLCHPELINLLKSAELLLEATGSAVSLCPRYGEAE